MRGRAWPSRRPVSRVGLFERSSRYSFDFPFVACTKDKSKRQHNETTLPEPGPTSWFNVCAYYLYYHAAQHPSVPLFCPRPRPHRRRPPQHQLHPQLLQLQSTKTKMLLMIMLMTMVTTTDAEAKQPCKGHPAGTPAGYNLAAGTRAARKSAGHNRVAGTRAARNPAARTSAARSSAAHNPAAHNPAAHNPAAHNPAARCCAARCSIASFAHRFARGRAHRRLAH